MYKLIAMDLDGTLLNDDKEISNENLKAINTAVNEGYEIVIATGRRYWSAKGLTKGIDSHITILANNGNIVKNSLNDKSIIRKYLDIKDFRTVVEDGKKRGLEPIVHLDEYDEGIDIAIEYDENYEGYYNYFKNSIRYKKVNSYLDIKDKVLAIVYPGRTKELNDFYLDIIEKYPGIYNAHVMENMVSAEAFLEIMNPKGTKWQSLIEYAETIDIKPEEIIAIGDNNNDASMIRGAGLGIAMNNGSESLKEIADVISAKNNNESGVAFELNRVLNI
jgi:Cof subfamily protein (haloacid dehalogenase superfamily)